MLSHRSKILIIFFFRLRRIIFQPINAHTLASLNLNILDYLKLYLQKVGGDLVRQMEIEKEQKIQKQVINPLRDPVRMKKTITQAQTAAFTTQLFYFAIKILFCFILYKTQNIIDKSPALISLFVCLLLINSYLLTIGVRGPGFEQKQLQQTNINDSQASTLNQQLQNYCNICKCEMKLRTKHCLGCGRCVRKYDHHCPWIGTCVGQNNHCYFFVMLFFQLLQSVFALWICFASMQLFEYKEGDGTFNPNFGVYAVFAIYMVFYILFVGGLLCFHLYLIVNNITTNQLIKRGSLKYLKGTKGNPFSQGCCKNILLSIKIPSEGQQKIDQDIVLGQFEKKDQINYRREVSGLRYGVMSIMIVVDFTVSQADLFMEVQIRIRMKDHNY